MEKYYTCKYDRAFKEVFLKESNKDLLKALLEKVLNVEIKELQVKPNERNQDNLMVKRKTYDALVKTEKEKIEIEVNANADEKYVNPRNLSYICDLYSHHTLKGEKYDEKTQIVQINFSYNLKDNKEKIREYYIQDDSKKKFVENLKIIEINMDYFVNMWYTKNEKEIDENKILIMLGLEGKELKNLSKEDKVVSKYMEELNKINEDPDFREYMTYEEDQRKIYNSRMSEAEEKGLEKGMKKGLEKGMKKGFEQGIEKGIEQGIEQGMIKVAKELLGHNVDIDIILSSTGLSKTELEKLKKEQ